MDPAVTASARVRVALRSQEDIVRYLHNYVRHEPAFNEEVLGRSRNCQTFAADFFALLSGQHGREPFGFTTRINFEPHLDWFINEPPDQSEPVTSAPLSATCIPPLWRGKEATEK